MSKRPKRRKYKDNPYTLKEITINNKYFISFRDSRGEYNNVEISKEIYELFDYYELRDLSQMNEYDNHIEHSEIYENKEKFQNDDRYKVFLGTWQKCGTGITLTAASYMIFLDTPWTYAVFEQACDRIYRIGTNKSVFIYKLICKDTVDEKVDKLLLSKQAISDYVIDDKISPDSIDELRNYIEELV